MVSRDAPVHSFDNSARDHLVHIWYRFRSFKVPCGGILSWHVATATPPARLVSQCLDITADSVAPARDI